MSIPPEQKYMADFWACQSEEEGLLRKKSSTRAAPSTIAFHNTLQAQRQIEIDDIPQNITPGTVIVIENISLLWIEALGRTLNINPRFFTGHISKHARSSTPWTDVFGSSPAEQKRPVSRTLPRWSSLAQSTRVDDEDATWYVDGIIEYGWVTLSMADLEPDVNFVPRRLVHNAAGGWHSHTRISCLIRHGQSCKSPVSLSRLLKARPTNRMLLDLILVDRPVRPVAKAVDLIGSRSKLRLPVANNRGGLQISGLIRSGNLSILACFQQFLSHSWHYDVLCPSPMLTPSPETIFHLLACSTFKANLMDLEKEIKHISFNDIRRPNALINDRLHDKRQDLAVLQTLAAMAKDWIPPSVKNELESVEKNAESTQAYIGFPDDILGDVLRDSKSLEKFLMDSFHLLVSSTSVMAAEANFKQAARAQNLAHLASIYIPLSFVTGIFGMNVKEINGSPLSLWVCAVALVIIALCTAAILAAFAWREKRKE